MLLAHWQQPLSAAKQPTDYFNQQERSFIRDKICAHGRTVVWIWAPGLVDDDHAAVESVSQLTGIRLNSAGVAPDGARCIVTNYTSPWTQGLPTNLRFGPDRIERKVDPLLYADDDQVMASQRLLAVHTRYAGERTIRLPRPCDVYDPFQEKNISRGAKEFRIELPAGGTGLWILRPAGVK